MITRIRKGDRIIVRDARRRKEEFPFSVGDLRLVTHAKRGADSVQIEGDVRFWQADRFDLEQRPIAADRDNKPIFAGDRVFQDSKDSQFEAEVMSASSDVGPGKRILVRRLDTGEEVATVSEHLILVRHHWEPEDRMVKAMRELRAAWETHQDMQKTQVAVVAEFMTRAILTSIGRAENRQVIIPGTSWEAASPPPPIAPPTNWQMVKPGARVAMKHRTVEYTTSKGLVQSTGVSHGKRNLHLRGSVMPFHDEEWEITALVLPKPQPPLVDGSIIVAAVAKPEFSGGELHLIAGDWTSPSSANVYPKVDVVNHGFTVIRDAGKDTL